MSSNGDLIHQILHGRCIGENGIVFGIFFFSKRSLWVLLFVFRFEFYIIGLFFFVVNLFINLLWVILVRFGGLCCYY